MTKPITRAGVVGAGVMGSGIAAHLANAGIDVVLLDIVPPNLDDRERSNPKARNRFADEGLEKALKIKPAAFFHESHAALVSTGNVDDDLDRLAECDLVIEAIIEKLEVKRRLFDRLERAVSKDAIVASNTSGLRIHDMLEGSPEHFRKRFLIMHFFNPVRYMKLLELVPGPETDADVLDRVARFGEDVLGKGVVVGKDTPNFVGNRIGAHSMMVTLHQMLEDGLAPEDVDAITGTPMAHPKSASFRTADLVGLDTFVHVADNCHDALVDDEEREVFAMPQFVRTMLDRGLLGNKTRAGFYKKEAGAIRVFDPRTLEYRDKSPDDAIRKTTKALAGIADPEERLRKLVADEGPVGRFAWKVLSRSMAYAARRIGEIADSVAAVDDALRWGYNWELGPFEVWDALGFAATVDRMEKDGVALPESILRMRRSGAPGFYAEDGKVWDLGKSDWVARSKDPRRATLADVRRGAAVLSNDGAEAWDLGDGVLGVTYKTKANSLDGDVIQLLGEAIDRAERDFEAMLVFNEGEHFSVGANLFLIVVAAQQKQWDTLHDTVGTLQKTFQRLKFCRVPVVAAPYGMTLGGGLEVCLASDAVQAAAETYAGQVEAGVGIIPGGAGTLNLLWRALEGIPQGTAAIVQEYVTQVFKNVALATVATSAAEAKHLGYFRHTDGVSFDRARHLTEAKARAVGMARSGYHPPVPRAHRLPGESGIASLQMMIDTLVAGGYATEHDGVIAAKLAHVLCGGASGATHKVTEDEMLELEREAFVSLCGEPKSIERMQYMLMNNKPLRN